VLDHNDLVRIFFVTRDPVMDVNGHKFERCALELGLVNRPGTCLVKTEDYPKAPGEAACALAR
jgi:hypothetical protein